MQTREAVKKIYCNYLETDEQPAPKEIEKEYKMMRSSFDAYIGEIMEDSFIRGYCCAMELMGKTDD